MSSRCVLLQPRRRRALADLARGLIYVPVMIMPAGDPYFINQMCSAHIPHHGRGCGVGRCELRLAFFFCQGPKLTLYKRQMLLKTGFVEEINTLP